MKVNIIHSQLRMHCRHHHYELHVIDDPICLRGLDVEDTKHYFMNCPLYNTNRTSLINTVNALFSNFSVDVVLYGDDSIDIEQNCVILQQFMTIFLIVRDLSDLIEIVTE